MNLRNKRLLILGAGRGQIGLYKAAKELGIVTIAGTMPGKNLPCLDLADEVCYMNIADSKEVINKSSNIEFDGVATCCLDTGIIALGQLCDKYKLIGLSGDAALRCNSKYDMKKAFMQNNVSTAKFKKVSNLKDIDNALDELNLPLIIKATDLQGSKGIYIAKSKNEVINGFNNAMKLTKKDYCIIEEYIEGWEFGAQSFVFNNDILFVMPHGDETFMSHTAVPVGHYVPLEADQSLINKIKNEVKKAIKALNLNNCAVNVDLICKDNEIYVIELTGRVGANCLPELVEINYGIEYYKMIALMAIGENPLELWKLRSKENTAGYAKMLFQTSKNGNLESMNYDNSNDNIRELTFFKKIGDEVNIFENSNDCLGQIIVKGKNIDECKEIINNFERKLEFKIK